MDLFDSAFTGLWKELNNAGVRYILVGGMATNLQGYLRYTGDMDLFIEDTPDNRKRLRIAFKSYSELDLPSLETIQFIPGWVNFPLNNGMQLDIMTSMKGVEASFAECLALANSYAVEGVPVPVLHINQLIANKKAVGRPKDQLDVINLEKIQQLQRESGAENKD